MIENNTYFLKIADIFFKIESFYDQYTLKEFKDYITDTVPCEYISVKCILKDEDLKEPSGKRLTQHSESNWYLAHAGSYALSFYDAENECICANMYYDPKRSEANVELYDVNKHYGVDTEFFLYNILERVFRISLIFNGGFAVHASSIVHEGWGLAFSAESGTGKSTHTGLWMETYPGTYILNDDAPALRLKDGTWYMYGTPWAGTTGINENVAVPLKALVFLERSTENTIRDASTPEAIRRLFEAIIHPMSDEVTDIIFDLVSSFISNSKICVLGCNISPEAPKTVKNYLF